MNRIERALGILLRLRTGKTVPARELAAHFEVSTRTIYRDVDLLSRVGVPVYATLGREGGLRLMEGYFLPPVMFSPGEAVALLLGLTSLRRLRAYPYPDSVETAQDKLIAALPEHMAATLERLRQLVGFEGTPTDAFSLEQLPPDKANDHKREDESAVLKVFLEGLIQQRWLAMRYHSPYSSRTQNVVVRPGGMVWDRDHWYLIAAKREAGASGKEQPRFWRADRVLRITAQERFDSLSAEFDVRSVLGRAWLSEAMRQWIRQAPVKIRLTQAQADRLQQDWYYSHAKYEKGSGGRVEMTFGQDRPEFVLELVRWLGPGAELLEPREWRQALAQELGAMAALYSS